MKERIDISSHKVWIFILFWLFYFILRGVQFALIDSFAPLIFSGFLCVVTLLVIMLKGSAKRRLIKFFGLSLMLYGLLKALLGLALKVAPVNSVHASESTSFIYFLLSILIFMSGFYIFKFAKKSN